MEVRRRRLFLRINSRAFHLHRKRRVLRCIALYSSFEGGPMSTLRLLLVTLALTLGVSATAFAKVNCSDVKNKNQDECVRARANYNNGSNINCSNAKNKNRDECVRAKANYNNGNNGNKGNNGKKA